MDLKELQTMFCSLVTKQEEKSFNKEDLLNIITGGGSLNSENALDVYSQDYQARMRDALSQNYEATWLFMGDEEFFECADKYIQSYPSHLLNLTNYGEEFPEMLEENSELIDASKMAMFERAFWQNFHKGDKAVIHIDEEMIKNGEFDLSNFAFIESEMRLDLVWTHREEGSNVLAELEIYEQSYFLIYKALDLVEIRRVSEIIYSFLKNLKECRNIANVKERDISPEMWVEIFGILRFSNKDS